MIDKTSDEAAGRINWTKAWSKKYPVLAAYQDTVDVNKYAAELERLLDHLQKEYGYSELDTFLVLKEKQKLNHYRQKPVGSLIL